MNDRKLLANLSFEQCEFDPAERDCESFYKEYCENQTVCGIAIEFNPVEETIKVQLSTTVYGVLPYTEATIYQLSKCEPGKAPKQIATLLGKTIRFKIIHINLEEEKIILSRKKNMLEALQLLQENFEQNPDDVYKAIAICARKNLTYTFELYEGIRIRCHVTEISATIIQLDTLNVEESVAKFNKWFYYGQKVRVKILEKFDGEYSSFNVSVKLADTRTYAYYLKRTCYFGWKNGKQLIPLKVKIAEPIMQNGMVTGYFCEVAPPVRGIVDVPNNTVLEFGSVVEAKLKKVCRDERKMYLQLI